MGLEEFIQNNYPNVWDTWLIASDPNYFQVGQNYQPMVSGYRGLGKRYRTFKCIEITSTHIILADIDDKRENGALPYRVPIKDAIFRLSKPLKYDTNNQ